MAQIFDTRIDFHQGGTAQEEIFSVMFLVWCGLTATHTELDDHVQEMTNQLLPVLRPDVFIKNVTMSVNKGPGEKKGKDRNFLTFGMNKQGTRVLPVGAVASRLAVGLMFRKDSDVMGDSGDMLLRGTLTDKDIKTGADGFDVLKDDFDKSASETLCTWLKAQSDADFRIVLPAKKGDNYISGSRNIYAWTLIGLGEQKVRNNRRTSKQKQDAAARDEIVPIFARIKGHIADGLTIDDIFAAYSIVADIAEVITKYGPAIVKTIGVQILGKLVYASIKAKIPALPA